MGGSRRRDSSKKVETKKYDLAVPTWPDACPTRHAEKIMSIVAGNTHLNWAVHEGEVNGFTPILFWRTPPLHPDEKTEDPCEVLARHLPPQAHAIIFGETTASATKSNAAAIAAMRRVPALNIFVISTNEVNENAVGFLFQDVPSRIFKLRTEDFFEPSAGAYKRMGVDRAATLRAAISMHSMPSLVIDAGTALTYTGMDRYGKIMGGGICPGINSRFRSLHDYCGALPRIEFEDYKKFVEQMKDANDVAVSIFSKDTREQIMVNAFTEVAFKCRNAISHFLEIVGEGKADDEGEDSQVAAVTVEEEKETEETEASPDAMDVESTKPAADENGVVAPKEAPSTTDEKKTTDSVDAATASGAETNKTTSDDAASKPADGSAAAVPMETEKTSEPAGDLEKVAEKTTEAEKKPASMGNGKGVEAKNPPTEKVAAVEVRSEAVPSIIITGGDAAFLEMLLNLENLDSGRISGIPGLPDAEKYEIRSIKHLIHYGISAVLTEKFKLYNIDDPDQELRHRLVGLRIAKQFDQADRDGDKTFRGSVIFVKSEESKDKKEVPPIEDDYFHIRYDDGDTEDITLLQLYSGLLLYQEVGEKTAISKSAGQDEIERKKSQAVELSEALIAKSNMIKEAKEKYEKEKAERAAKEAAEKEAKEAAKAAKRSSSSVSSVATPVSSKKAKKSLSPSSSVTSAQKITKESFIGRRVAKLFPMEDEKGNPIKVVFFGQIDKLVDDSDGLWHVQYDDDDEEEFDEKDVRRALRLYEKEKKADKNAK